MIQLVRKNGGIILGTLFADRRVTFSTDVPTHQGLHHARPEHSAVADFQYSNVANIRDLVSVRVKGQGEEHVNRLAKFLTLSWPEPKQSTQVILLKKRGEDKVTTNMAILTRRLARFK